MGLSKENIRKLAGVVKKRGITSITSKEGENNSLDVVCKDMKVSAHSHVYYNNKIRTHLKSAASYLILKDKDITPQNVAEWLMQLAEKKGAKSKKNRK